MIKSYKYINTVHTRLHEFVIAFFRSMETSTGGFRDDLFEPPFLDIVNHHPKILKKRFKEIYEYVYALPGPERSSFCQRIIESNQIDRICRGEYRPKAFVKNPPGIEKVLKELFVDLYNQVLDGTHFQNLIQSCLRDHFNQFSETNKDITLCPMCGIGELKGSDGPSRDQYDHYLPKAIYPFSSVNFNNLIPCCIDCNSPSAKGDKDTIGVSTGKLFYPYDGNHKGVTLKVILKEDANSLEEIKWQLTFENPDNKNDEIESWKTIYSIDERYQDYIKLRIGKWYRHFYNCVNRKISNLNFEDRVKMYSMFIEQDESLGLNFIRKPSLDGLLKDSNIFKAEIEALQYS